MVLPSIISKQSYAAWRMKISSMLLQKESGSEFYWILDACAHPKLPGILWELEQNPEARPLYMNTYKEEVSAAGPYILPANDNNAVSRWFFEQSNEKPVGCLIEIAAGFYPVAFEHLQQQLECYPGNEHLTLFRWYDPRILYGLSTYSEQDHIRARFMGPVLYFHAWEPGRCSDIVYGIGRDLGIRSEAPEYHDEKLFDHIWDEVSIHTIIGTLGSETGMKLRSLPLPEAYKLVEQVQQILLRYNYFDRRSLAYGASITAKLGLDIWERADVREAFEQRPPNAPIDEVIESLDI